MVTVSWRDRLSDADAGSVRELLLAARALDGRPEVAESGPLPAPFRTGEHGLATDGAGRLAGYAHVDTKGDAQGRPVVELIVHPDRRRRGVGSALTAGLVERITARPVRAWSHGDHPGAARIAGKFGFARVRELRQLSLDLDPANPPPQPRWPAGVASRTFVVGRDEPDVVRVNRRAFDWHPEQGALTVDDLAAAEDEPWFDPAGFFLAVDARDRVVGFHWTKVHDERPPVGEVYVVGVDPEAQGGGLGTALTLVGLRHLHGAGLSRVILYVESDNAPALAVYHRLGFTLAHTDVQYELAPSVDV